MGDVIGERLYVGYELGPRDLGDIGEVKGRDEGT